MYQETANHALSVSSSESVYSIIPLLIRLFILLFSSLRKLSFIAKTGHVTI